MGLDMYLHHVRKPAKSQAELEQMSYEALQQYWIFIESDETLRHIEPLMNLVVKLSAAVPYINMEQIMADNDIPAESPLVGESISMTDDQFEYLFSCPDDHVKSVCLSKNDIETKYIIHKDQTIYVCETQVIAYWRKEYALASALMDAAAEPVGNCEFCPMTDDMWNVLHRLDPVAYEKAIAFKDIPDSLVCYYEWY